MAPNALCSIFDRFLAMYAHGKALRRVVLGLAAGVVLVATGPAQGQIAGTLSVINGDPLFQNCVLFDTAPKTQTLWIVHRFNQGSYGVRFKVASEPGVTMTYTSETHPIGTTAGTTQTGLSVCYGACINGEQLVATITYMAFGTSSPCSKVLVVPHPAAQTVESLLCAPGPASMLVEDLFVTIPSIGCSACPPQPHGYPGTPQSFDCTPVSVEKTTWGAIKALYAR